MTRIERIADQMQRAYAGEAWHGPSLQELLKGVDAATASQRPIPAAHNIWELVVHIRAWILSSIRRMNGDPANLTPAEDWPAVSETSDAAWQRTLAELDADHQKLYQSVKVLQEPGLKERAFGQPYSVEFMLYGVIEHMLYHAGQIALLKKAMASS